MVLKVLDLHLIGKLIVTLEIYQPLVFSQQNHLVVMVMEVQFLQIMTKYAEKIKMMRVHGQNKRYYHKYVGMGGRLDTIQAAILLAKLPHYSNELECRNNVAKYYSSSLSANIETPLIKSNRSSAWAQYTTQS